ncbi:MAG: glycyl-radical enzyme activating protein [Peptococcaceae bacterium]|jgi:pyruvate formate lyase activating enzyme|nr:glycyl-radical enzyme activating protein [Peptococcaceae bacterium]MDH7525971.1 glycyl-radical enzyme activating protein [Peptococcaceae bacterium]
MEQTRGLIFHIIHGSFVDGYGIRTTLFLKGCPLRCVWCCNPEGQAFYPELKVTAAKCNGCGKCVSVCPVGAIRLLEEKDKPAINVDRKLCANCGQCIEICFAGALEWFGKYYTVEEIFENVKKDQHFYRSSEGGVTIGGGEATWQPEFTLELIKKCKENYIHTAIDTCGYVTSPEGVKCLEEADLLLFDIKDMDPDRHIKNTGRSNEPILKNLKRLNDMGKPIIIRVPVVPGYNDFEENLKATAKFLAGLKSVERVDIIPVHEFGKVKYEQLGKEYRLKTKPLDAERQDEIKAMFEHCGLNTQIGG